MRIGHLQKRLLLGIAAALALLTGAASAMHSMDHPGDEILLTASTRAELNGEFRKGVAGIPGVLSMTDVGRLRVYLVRTRDAQGSVVDQAPRDFFYALDAMVFDPASYPPFVGAPGDPLTGLGEGEVVLGVTSAKVRRLGPGSVLELLDGTRLIVRAIVDDQLIQNRELALASPGFANGEGPSRPYLLIRYDGPQDTIEAQMQAILPEETALRLRALEPSEFLASPAAILPQAQMKVALGEFAYRPTAGRTIVRDPAWESDNLANAEIPLLGRVRCHVVLIPALQGAMQELIDAGLGDLIVPEAFQGCDNPRLIGVGRGFSRHAWGAAVDINYSDDTTVRANGADPRLVAIMDRWGFTSGHLWHNPDPGHFEYVGPPKI